MLLNKLWSAVSVAVMRSDLNETQWLEELPLVDLQKFYTKERKVNFTKSL